MCFAITFMKQVNVVVKDYFIHLRIIASINLSSFCSFEEELLILYNLSSINVSNLKFVQFVPNTPAQFINGRAANSHFSCLVLLHEFLDHFKN